MKFPQTIVLLLLLVVASGCKAKSDENNALVEKSLLQARAGFTTKIVHKEAVGEAAQEPPANIFKLVKYPTEIGDMAAYVSPSPADGKKHPAIIWIVGGFSSSIGDVAWTPGPVENDQSASAFREAGIIMMYPSVRGGNDNPGFMESFYGEVNDVLAAEAYLAKLDYVDPKRIYLGGHSTGGTLALLVVESADRFRAVFAFGPVADVRSYGAKYLTFDLSNPKEAELRAPEKWLQAIHNPTFVFEGTKEPSNISSLRAMARVSQNSMIHFLPVNGATHFGTLSPVTRLIAKKILLDDGVNMNITFIEDELAGLFGK